MQSQPRRWPRYPWVTPALFACSGCLEQGKCICGLAALNFNDISSLPILTSHLSTEHHHNVLQYDPSKQSKSIEHRKRYLDALYTVKVTHKACTWTSLEAARVSHLLDFSVDKWIVNAKWQLIPWNFHFFGVLIFFTLHYFTSLLCCLEELEHVLAIVWDLFCFSLWCLFGKFIVHFNYCETDTFIQYNGQQIQSKLMSGEGCLGCSFVTQVSCEVVYKICFWQHLLLLFRYINL